MTIVGVILIASYFVYAFLSANSFFNAIQEDPISSQEEEMVIIENKEPFSILLLGVDERPGDIGRADTIIVATVNPNTEDVKLLSILEIR